MSEHELQGFCKHVFQDWRANGTVAGLALATYRLGSWRQHHVESPVPRALLGVCYLLAKFSVGRLSGWCAIDPRAEIGPRLRLPHGGAGVVINSSAVLGSDCILYHQVTIGTDPFAEDDYWAARLGDNVFIGPGAKILGSISIGSHAVIGANAVVTHDVPPNAVAVGVPARILPGVERKQFHPASRLT
jgi:serine O-acetyltransferase